MQTRDRRILSNRRDLGTDEENNAVSYLESEGCRIIERNFYSSAGEIDIIYTDKDGTICFGEVKYRKNTKDGQPEEAVNLRKQKRICRASDHFRSKFSLDESFSYRYDVIALTPYGIKWIKDAFEYIERF